MPLTEQAVNDAYKNIVSVLFNQLFNSTVVGDAQAVSRFDAGLKLAQEVRNEAISVLIKNSSP